MGANQETLLSANEVMRRVRMRLGVGDISASPVVSASIADIGISASGFVASPPTEDFPIKSEYVVADFLCYDDVAFIVNAYRAVLGRDPDDGALEHLRSVRGGWRTKVEILGLIRWSPEGVARGVHIDGLLLPFKLHQWHRLPLIGRFLSWLHSLARLHRNGRVMETHIGSVSGDLQHLQALLSRAASEQAIQLDAHARMLETLPSREDLEVLARQIQTLPVREDVEVLTRQIQTLAVRGDVEAIALQMQALPGRDDIEALAQRTHVLAKQLAELQLRQDVPLVPMVTASASGQVVAGAEIHNSAVESRLDALYADFEDQFRGPQEQIRLRLAPYVKFIRDVGAGTPSAPVLDLGCGRGEWLELLREAGLEAAGVDLNMFFVRVCLRKQLDVEFGDALSKLKSLPDASVGVVSLFHLAEHLDFASLIELIDEAHRVLVPGGGFIAETPNPENALVAQWTFYMDPTHRNPLPPQMLRWVVNARGFVQSDIKALFDARPASEISYVADDVPGAQTINALVKPHHAALDYAVIARKSVSQP